MKSSKAPLTSHEYLIEMSFAPFASLPSPQELVAFIERMALPTLEALARLADSGRIRAGGPALAASGLTFIALAESPQDLEDMVAGLPLWPRAQTRIVPLGTFASRAAAVRERLVKARVAQRASALQAAHN
jgi:hypothetical protein